VAASCWLAHSKLRVEPWNLCEGMSLLVPRLEGTAWGWLHRAVTTSGSGQWRDHRLLLLQVNWAWWPISWTITFFTFVG